MSHLPTMSREIADIVRKARAEKMAAHIADSARLDSEAKDKSAALVADWQARFNAARNAACEGQKNFSGI